jgi:hypothetical protein
MRELFEQYIVAVVNGELRQLQEIFSEAKRNAFGGGRRCEDHWQLWD